jgi:hypothetical protein
MREEANDERRRLMPGRRAAWLLSLGLAACAGQVEELPGSGPAEMSGLHRDLGPGSQGDDVAAVQGYLLQYGYFPNPELARTYPSWRPIVKRGPDAIGTYDAQTETAVRALQKNFALAVTGRVDQATRSVLRQWRCHEPDGLAELDPSDKFSFPPSLPRWNKTNITWRYFHDNASGLTDAQARVELRAAFSTWAAPTNLTFTEITSGIGDITLRWAAMPGRASTDHWPPNPTTTFSLTGGLVVSNPTPANLSDFQSAALHEIGHDLGLNHTRVLITTSVMNVLQSGEQRRSLTSDDLLAIKLAYDPWVFVRSHLSDVSHNAGRFWGISDGFPDPVADNNVFRMGPNGGAPIDLDNMTGIAISVDPDGIPWVVRSNGGIFQRNSADGPKVWTQKPGCGWDVGAGGPAGAASVWVIGCSNSPDGLAYRWNGASWTPDAAGGTGARIAVDSAGIPWLAKRDGRVFRRSSSNPASGSWTQLPGNPTAVDLAVDNTGEAIWAFITIQSQGIFAWNEQTGGDGDETGSGFPNRATWIQMGGRGKRVSVRNSMVMVIDTSPNNDLYRLQQ